MAGSFFKYLLGAGTGAGVYAGYDTVQQAASLKTGLEESVGAAATGTASALGGLLGSVKAGFSSASTQTASPQPVVTHVYHDGGRGGVGQTGTSVLVIGSIALVSYGGVCWYFHLDFFGMSRQRTENLLHALNGKVKDYSAKVQTEIDRLRGKIDDSAVEQMRQADVLSQVNQTVQKSGADLEHIGLQNADLAHALGEARATSDSMAQGMLAIQYFLVQVAKGSVHSREDALRMLEASMHEQSAVLMQGQAQLGGPQGGLPGGGGLLPAAPAGAQGHMLPITAPDPAGPGRHGAVGATGGAARGGVPASTGGRADSSARAESSGRGDAENAAPQGTWTASIWHPVKAVSGWLSTARGNSSAGAQQPMSHAPFPNGATPHNGDAATQHSQSTPKVPSFSNAHAAQHPHAGQHPHAAHHPPQEGSPFTAYQAAQPLHHSQQAQRAGQAQHAGQQYAQQPGQPGQAGRPQYGPGAPTYQDPLAYPNQPEYQDGAVYQGQAPPAYAATHAYAQTPVDGYPAPSAPPAAPMQSYTSDGFPSSPRHAASHYTSTSSYTAHQQVSTPAYTQGSQFQGSRLHSQYVQPELLTATSSRQLPQGSSSVHPAKQPLSTQTSSVQQFSGQYSAGVPRAMSRAPTSSGGAAFGGVTIEEVDSSPRHDQNPAIKHPSFF